jgi:hypothetical protein
VVGWKLDDRLEAGLVHQALQTPWCCASLEVHYNNERLDSALRYQSPRQYESRYQPEKRTTFSQEKVTATLCAEAGAKVKRANGINVQVIRSYSWAAAESPKNSQGKPVNNCGGGRIFLKLRFETWKSGRRPQKRAAGLLRMDLN